MRICKYFYRLDCLNKPSSALFLLTWLYQNLLIFNLNYNRISSIQIVCVFFKPDFLKFHNSLSYTGRYIKFFLFSNKTMCVRNHHNHHVQNIYCSNARHGSSACIASVIQNQKSQTSILNTKSISSAIFSQLISGKNSESKYNCHDKFLRKTEICRSKSNLNCRSRHLCIKLTHTT